MIKVRQDQGLTEVNVSDVLLVSSPGYGVLDSGCGRAIIGSSTLQSFEKLWAQRGWSSLGALPRYTSSSLGMERLRQSSCWRIWWCLVYSRTRLFNSYGHELFR